MSRSSKPSLVFILPSIGSGGVSVFVEDDLFHMNLTHVFPSDSERVRLSSVFVVTVLVGGVLAHEAGEVGTVVTASSGSIVFVR